MDPEVAEKSRKYIKYIAFVVIGIIVLIILFSLNGGNNYSKIENEMINKSKNYFRNSLNYVTLEDMNLKYDGCRTYSGVYHVNSSYVAYLFCDDYTNVSGLTSNNITLIGSNPMIMQLGETFSDPGYQSKYNIEVIKNIKQFEGLHSVTYVAKENNQVIDQVKRLIIIKGGSNDSFALKGEQEINIFKGDDFIDPGYSARDDKGYDISSLVTVSGKVNNKVSGIYEIIYVLNRDNVRKELKRTVKVLDLEPYIEIETTKPSSQPNVISLIVTGKDYSYTILPDGTTNNDREIEYEVKNNGTYNFKIYAGNKYVVKTVTINNIYQALTASCTISQSGDKIFATVTSSGGYGNLQYSYLDKSTYSNYTSEKTYYFKNKVKETTIKIKDESGNIKSISCSNPNIKLLSSLEIHFIANGHYDDSILIRTDDKVIYIDGGRKGCENDDLNYLRGLGVTKIDYMIGSHVEYDHIQAQAHILDNLKVDRILYPVNIYTCVSQCYCQSSDDTSLVLAALKRNNKTAETVSIPSKIVAGDMTLYFIAPWNKVCNNNNNSFIFILTYGNNSFMFTGDAYSAFNDLTTLTNNAKQLGLKDIDVDMLKYPHHGNNPMSDKLLNAIKPEMVVVPNFHASKYPTESNQQLIRNHGAKIYRQSDSSTGNITLISDGTTIKVYMNSSASTYKR